MPKKMPGRPFQHVLETRSRTALTNALPDEWVLESREHDYGIDLDIEIFEEGAATGLRIPVQLKGQQDSGSPARVKLKKTSISYWKESDSPVIVIIWDEKTDSLWWEWQYLLDTHKSKDTAVKVSVVVGRKWGASTALDILREARAHKAAVRGEYETPLPLNITIENDLRGDQAITRLIVAKVRRSLLARPEVVLARGTESGQLMLDVRRTEVSIRLRGTAGVVLHFDKQFRETGAARDELVTNIVDDILSSVATLSGAVGLRALTDFLLGQVAERSQLLLSERGLARSLGQLAQAGDFDAFTTLFVRAVCHDNDVLRAIAWQSLAFFTDVIPSAKRLALIARIEGELPRGDDYSRALYSLAQTVKNDDSAIALRLFMEAASEDPAYKRRAYWWSDIGAIYFNGGRFDKAVECYLEAVKLSEDSTLFLLADAYLMSGQLDEALATFTKASESGLEEVPEWKMKRICFQVLRVVLAAEYHPDMVDPSLVVDVGLDLNLGDNPLQELVERLNLDFREPDLLGALALFLHHNAGIQTFVMMSFAFMSRGNPVAWTMALEALVDTHPELLSDLAVCAMQQCGEQLLEYQAIEGVESVAVHDALVNVFQPDRPYILRTVQTGASTFESLRIR